MGIAHSDSCIGAEKVMSQQGRSADMQFTDFRTITINGYRRGNTAILEMMN